MLVRILQFLVGAALAGGGGYLAWMNRDDLGGLFPPGPAGPPWMLVLGVAALAAGLVFLASAVLPRPNQRREKEARAAKRAEQLGEAEAYYAEAGRAADRDWRSGDIPPPAVPEPQPAPAPVEPLPQAIPPARAVASAAPPTAHETVIPPVEQAPAESVFPSTASLAPIPPAQEPPPIVASASVTAAPVAMDDPHAAIRNAIKDGRLDEAERLLEAARETAQGLVLAELTGLAGDHAAAAGRASHAKWLWRLALKRFGEEGAMGLPAAKAVAEQLRVTG